MMKKFWKMVLYKIMNAYHWNWIKDKSYATCNYHFGEVKVLRK